MITTTNVSAGPGDGHHVVKILPSPTLVGNGLFTGEPISGGQAKDVRSLGKRRCADARQDGPRSGPSIIRPSLRVSLDDGDVD